MSRRSIIGGSTIAVVCALAASAPAGAATRAEQVSGSFYTPGCEPTGTDFYDPVSSDFNCGGASTWTGTWTGESIYRSQGTSDVITGDVKGTIEERLFAQTVDGHKGELYLAGTVTIAGATNAENVTEKIIDGSGDFAGATGTVYATGAALGPGPASGTYTGNWTHPAYGSSGTANGGASSTSSGQSGPNTSRASAKQQRAARHRGRHHRSSRHHRKRRHQARRAR